MIKLVVVDFDDTLCMTEADQFSIENEVIGQMGFQPMTREVHKKNWGVPLQKAIEERVPGIDSDEFMKRFATATAEFVASGKSDVISSVNFKTLEILQEKGIKTAVLTSRTLGEAKHLMDTSHPLSSRLDAFYHKQSSPYAKPDPRVFDLVIKDFAFIPSEMVYVGDSRGDAEAAKSAGLHFIALLESGLRGKETFEGITVDYFAHSFSEILMYIERINKI